MTGEISSAHEAVEIIVTVHNRPIYLWACLDSLFRLTRTPYRLTLIDMASDHPMVPEVVRGFERRGLISQVLRAPANDPALLADTVMSRLDELSPFFVYIDADAVLVDRDDCWLQHVWEAMTAHPGLAMLGSAIDGRDFVDPQAARALEPHMEEARLASLIKAFSPERHQRIEDAGGRSIFLPHNPPGRLLTLRTDALRRVGPGTDAELDTRLRALGYETGILTTVKHRHLSLLHIFDEPGYGYAERDEFMLKLDGLGA